MRKMNKTLRRAIAEPPKRLYLGCVEQLYSEINLQSARMVGTGVSPQVCHWDQYPSTNSPSRQAPGRNQVIQRMLANREHLRSFSPAQEKLLFSANCRLLVGM
jgi:hypothetical protein